MTITTLQRVELDTKEGKRFLRRVIRENDKLDSDQCWRVDSRAESVWTLRFYRTEKGDIGTADQDIEVATDHGVILPHSGDTGPRVQSFSDSKPVIIPDPRYLQVSSCSQVATLARFLLDGFNLSICASAGSSSSSRHGLAFYSVNLSKGWERVVELPGQTVLIDGRQVCAGLVSV